MAKSKRRNPDHAHKDRQPSQDNAQLAAQLEALLTPVLRLSKLIIGSWD